MPLRTAPAANPWLTIPAADYERHMGAQSVRQLQFLNETFRTLVAECTPATALIPGCTTGNGFEHFDPSVTTGIIGVDINPEYLGILYRRFGKRLPGLALVCADIETWDLPPRSIDLVHCALILEYVDPATLIGKSARWLKPGGTLSVVLQIPSGPTGKVSSTDVISVRQLESAMTLVEPDDLTGLADHYGLQARRTTRHTLASGKTFFVASYCLVS
jgi:SAM-dependent methyltransferase